jgi:acylpyruvate hydrolase
MRFFRFETAGVEGLATAGSDGVRGLLASEKNYPGDLDDIVRGGLPALRLAAEAVATGRLVDLDQVSRLPPLRRSEKIICVGLNYRDHSAESGFTQPNYPTLFCRFNSSLIGDGASMIIPSVSDELDFEGELVAIIGKGGRNIALDQALDHVIAYSIFNDGSVRNYQFKTPQWTIGKNFDGTGSFGPALVTTDELPAGAVGLQLETRLNHQVVQRASTNEMVFDVATLISIISEAITLRSGDMIVTGTPSGVGVSRKPPLFMKPGDVVEVEIEKIGVLRNPISQEAPRKAALHSA